MSEEVTISKSKQKREQRKAEAKAAKAKKNVDNIITWVVGVIIAAVVIGVIVMGIIQSASKTTSSDDFSAGLTNEGYVSGANLDKVDVTKFESFAVSYSDVEYTEEAHQKDIDSTLSGFQYYSTDAIEVADGDTVMVNYTGYVDDVAFDGGSTNGTATALKLGSGTYIPGFEDQLIGHKVGDDVTVNVTFPDEYQSAELAGKAARFEVNIQSVLATPEYTDEFVAANLSSVATTVEEYDAYLKKVNEENNLKTAVANYVEANADSCKSPASYVKKLKSVTKYSDEQQYMYYNQYFQQMFGSSMYATFNDYSGLSDADYEKKLKEDAVKQCGLDLTYEKIFKEKGLTITDEIMDQVTASYGEDGVSVYGEGFLNQVALKFAVVSYLSDVVSVN